MIKPYESPLLPIYIETDVELVNLLAEASMKYGEYLGYYNSLGPNKKDLLLSFIKMDSFKSTQIEGTNVSQSELFSLENISNKNDDQKEITNYFKAFNYGKGLLQSSITLDDINKMHAILLDSKRSAHKNPGKLRTVQNWIGYSGSKIEDAIFIPPKPEDVQSLMEDFVSKFNKHDPIIFELVQVAINHAHFETIHPYNDGNGRLGRLLIPLNMAMLSNHEPVLYISEVLEMYKPAYYRALSDFRISPEKFVKFFLMCVTEQCSAYIYRIEKIKEVFESDAKLIASNFSTATASKIFDIFKRDVAVKVNNIVSELSITEKTARNIIKQMIELGIVSKKSQGTEYIYTQVYKAFVTKY